MGGAGGVLGFADERPTTVSRFGVALAVAVVINAGLLSLWTRWRMPDMESEEDRPIVDVIVMPQAARTGQRSMPSPRLHLPSSTFSTAPSPAVLADPIDRIEPPRGELPPGKDLMVDPQWQVDGGAYLTAESAKQARALFEMKENLDFERACMGQSSKALDSTQRERCIRRWAALAARFAQ